MRVEPGGPRTPRARPVGDAPVDVLLARVPELARRWAVAQILARPLEEIAEVPLEEIVRAAPGLCESMIRALASDEELERVERGEVPFPAATREPRVLVDDVDALRAVLWNATLAALEEPSTRLLAELADRLASVCATVLATMLATVGVGGEALSTAAVIVAGSTSRAGSSRTMARDSPTASRRTQALRTAKLGASGRAVTLIDELDEELPPLADGVGEREEEPAARAPAEPPMTAQAANTARAIGGDRVAVPPVRPRARPWDTPLEDTPLEEAPAMRVRRARRSAIDADEQG